MKADPLTPRFTTKAGPLTLLSTRKADPPTARPLTARLGATRLISNLLILRLRILPTAMEEATITPALAPRQRQRLPTDKAGIQQRLTRVDLQGAEVVEALTTCLLYTSPSPRDS